jgi:hypothetical protein
MNPGSITHGTLRPQDLLPAFLDALRDLDPSAYAQLHASPFGPIPAHALEDAEADWWNSDAADALLSDIRDDLAMHAPPYCVFGPHPGAGADIGFWVDWDMIRSDIKAGDLRLVHDLAGVPDGDPTPLLLIGEQGPATLYDAGRQVIWRVAEHPLTPYDRR